MDARNEIKIKDEPLDGKEFDGANDQIYVLSGLQEIPDENCDSDIDFKSEIEVKEEPEFEDFGNLIEEDCEEKSEELEKKCSLRIGHELTSGNKGAEKHDRKEFCCSNCDFSFESEGELRSHLESLCEGKVNCSPGHCGYCESNSKIHQLKHRNMDNSILNSKLFKCFICSFSCKQKSSLNRHTLTHQKTKLFKCSECDYECNDKGHLKRHSLKHQKLKLFKCSKCDYECKRKEHLETHMLTHQNLKPFKCSKCDFECKHKGSLKRHSLKHQNLILFKCSECDHGCRRKDDLEKHMLKHQNIKLFKCPECKYECNYKRSLKTHMLRHQKVKLFKCSECEYECNFKGIFKKHMLKHQCSKDVIIEDLKIYQNTDIKL